MIKRSVVDLIGETPIIRLEKIEKDFNLKNELYIKVEKNNASGSIKDRACLNMILNYQKEGLLKPGSTIIEATSGNMGIALSMLCAYFDYKLIIVMPSSMSIQRRALMQAYGAELVLIQGGMKESEDKAIEIQKETPNSIIFNQFRNENNANAHYLTTAREIERDLPDLDYIFACFGTGGTVSGTARYYKEKGLKTKIIAIEPEQSPLLTKGEAHPHKIQGIGANFIPPIFKKEFIDEAIAVNDIESIEMARKLAHVEGLLCGISTGANVLGTINYLKEHKIEGKKVLTFNMDSGERYSWN